MIQRAFITEWRAKAPWALDEQVEQDLILARAIVELYTNPLIQHALAFRGGTALHKLFLPRPARYSEDIDLVQVEGGPIGPILDAVRGRLDSWLGAPKWKQGHGRFTLYYRFPTEIEPMQMQRLKIEINSREHFSVLGIVQRPFAISSRWWSGQADISTYALEEMLGTKLRALYQRKKGRDLFDLWIAARHLAIEPAGVVRCFQHYLDAEGLRVSRAQFEANLSAKLDDAVFSGDVDPLLTTGSEWNLAAAAAYARSELLALLPGDSWKGI